MFNVSHRNTERGIYMFKVGTETLNEVSRCSKSATETLKQDLESALSPKTERTTFQS